MILGGADDGFPQTICQQCVEQLQVCYGFIGRCMEVHLELQAMLGNPAEVSPSSSNLIVNKEKQLEQIIIKEEMYLFLHCHSYSAF